MRATPIPELARRQVRVRARFRCERCSIPTPDGHCHHRRSRSVRDEHTHHPCNLVWLCATCHEFVHRHPFDARANGWIVSRYVRQPGSKPYRTTRGWCTPDCTGTYTITTSEEQP